MDDIYDDLDNYDDLNIVEELKKENHDLKLKLEEYTIAMSKLQKDFDALSCDFKKLEMNYSSLLKTAKVEIERKTKIITDLNIEKDMIVLNALQKRNISDIRKLKSISKSSTKSPCTESSFGKARNKGPLTDSIKETNNSSGRKADIRFSSVETTTTSGNTDITSKLIQYANNSENVESWSDRTSDIKENIAQRNKHVENLDKPSNTQACSIKNRRKSMPAVRSLDKYSSDEEYEDRYTSNDVNRKSSREEPGRQIIDKAYAGRHRHKGADERNKFHEMPNADNKYYGYPEGTRDSYHRHRNDRHYAMDKHRSRNKYDTSSRHRRHFSPERSRRAFRHDNEYQRQEYSRFRVLGSPPPDRFQHCQQRNQEARYKRDRDNSYDLEKMADNYDKLSSAKHQTDSEHCDEPLSKRQRTESCKQILEEDKGWSHERVFENPIRDLYENLHPDLSCQSPDYIINDSASLHPVREIMNTASTVLEDPRIHSERYILKTSDDSVALSTVTGRNVNLKKLDYSIWNDASVEVPQPLTRRPSQCSEDIVKEIYNNMDIDNPVSNMSAESGEIVSYDVEDNTIEATNIPDKCNIQEEVSHVHNMELMFLDKKDEKKSLNKYKIPKVKKNESTNIPSTQDELRQSKCEKTVGNSTKVILVNESIKKTAALKDNKLDTVFFKNNNKISNCSDSIKSNKDSVSKPKQIVADDLELSDETCDNSEIQRKYAPAKHDIKDKASLLFGNKVSEPSDAAIDRVVKNDAIHEKDTVQDDSKKRSSKKKNPKSKENPKGTKTDSTEKEPDKKVSKKDTKDTKEIKTKFSELFGDSSSLITPEDLGILALQAQARPSATYVPICEDAQDAVDVTVSNKEKLQTRSKVKALETEQSQESPDTDNDSNKIEKIYIHDDSKKKSFQECDNSKIRDVYETLAVDKLATEKEKSPNLDEDGVMNQSETHSAGVELVAKQTITTGFQEPYAVAVCHDTSKKPIAVDEQNMVTLTNSDNMLPKANIAMRALATSTPQKELQQDHFVSAVVGQVLNCPTSSKELSDDVGTADQSSNNNTLASQDDDADIPDVRIFVKRKRRGKVTK